MYFPILQKDYITDNNQIKMDFFDLAISKNECTFALFVFFVIAFLFECITASNAQDVAEPGHHDDEVKQGR